MEKFVTGLHEIVLCLPEGDDFDWPGANIVHLRERGVTYLTQQCAKLYSDEWCSGDFILFQDSDTCFDRPIKPEDLMIGGNPFWPIRPYGDARQDQQIWRAPTEKYMGEPVAFEGMARHPFFVPRGVLRKMRAFCEMQHGIPLWDYIQNQGNPAHPLALVFSEWNALSAFSLKHARDQFHWIDLSKEEAPAACCVQGFSHGGEGRKQEDIAKFREILGGETLRDVVARANNGDTIVSDQAGIHLLRGRDMSVSDAISALVREARKAPVCKGRVLTALRKAGLVKRGKLMELPDDEPAPVPMKDPSVLLAIHSFPGANDCVERHWPHYYLSGATRIVGIGTTDGKCRWPVDCESVNIGKNKYIDGPHLPQRLADTIEWCLTQPEDRFIIAEYDVLFLGAVPPWTGAMLHRTGGKLPDAKASWFGHNPWCLDRESAARIMHELRAIIQEGHCQSRWPEASPDVALGYAVDRLKLPFAPLERMFTRNSLEEAGALDLAVAAVRDGATIIHGCKTPHAFDALVGAHKAVKRKRAA